MDKALLVGINKYPGSPLAGCVNDITDMANFLVDNCHFRSEDIRLLVDARATTREIFARLQWLADSRPGDRVLFHYSGHGAQVPARSDSGEVDGLYEVICPVDFDWSPGRMITDKQFAELFEKMPQGVKFNWLSDSCHSGDLDRDIAPAPNGAEVLGYRRYPVPADIAWRQRAARDKHLASYRAMVGGKLDVGFVGGCQSDQTSADASFKNRPNGAFTYFFLKTIKKMPGDPLTQVVPSVTDALRHAGFSQVPYVSGARVGLPFLG